MTTESRIQLDVSLAFPKASIVFDIEVKPVGDVSDEAAHFFQLSVTDHSTGRAVPFNADASAQLADWVRGYSRWLVRARITASYSEERVDGRFADGLEPDDVIRGVGDACDMIRQRFELYQETVLN